MHKKDEEPGHRFIFLAAWMVVIEISLLTIPSLFYTLSQ